MIKTRNYVLSASEADRGLGMTLATTSAIAVKVLLSQLLSTS
jgi:hypothetical protein